MERRANLKNSVKVNSKLLDRNLPDGGIECRCDEVVTCYTILLFYGGCLSLCVNVARRLKPLTWADENYYQLDH